MNRRKHPFASTTTLRMIQILYKDCPAAYAALTGKGNKLVMATLIRFIENTHSGGGVEIGFGFVMDCLQINYCNVRRKRVRSSAAVTIGHGRSATYENGVILGGRAGDGDGRASDVREVDFFGNNVVITG